MPLETAYQIWFPFIRISHVNSHFPKQHLRVRASFALFLCRKYVRYRSSNFQHTSALKQDIASVSTSRYDATIKHPESSRGLPLASEIIFKLKLKFKCIMSNKHRNRVKLTQLKTLLWNKHTIFALNFLSSPATQLKHCFLCMHSKGYYDAWVG